MRLARRRVAVQDDDAPQIAAQEQVDGPNLFRQLPRCTQYRQVVQRGLPVGRQVRVSAPAQVGGAQGSQRALKAIGLLAGRPQRLTGLVEVHHGGLAGCLGRGQTNPSLLYTFAVAGNLGRSPPDVLLEVCQARFTVALTRFVDCQSCLAFLLRQAVEHALQPSQIGLERAALFAQAGVPLACDGQAPFGDARLLSKTIGARAQNGQAFVECGQAYVERFQRLLAGQALAVRLLRRRGRRAQVVVSLAPLGVCPNESGAKRTQQQVVQLDAEGLGALRAIGLGFEATHVWRELGQDVLNAHQVGLGRCQLGPRVVQP